MKNGVIFFICYSFTMLFTYFWRASAISMIIEESSSGQSDTSANAVASSLLLLFINYLLLMIIAYYRGKRIEKKHLLAYPTIAGFFDIFIAFIPVVPTVMNLIALVSGVSAPQKVVYINANNEAQQRGEHHVK